MSEAVLSAEYQVPSTNRLTVAFFWLPAISYSLSALFISVPSP